MVTILVAKNVCACEECRSKMSFLATTIKLNSHLFLAKCESMDALRVTDSDERIIDEVVVVVIRIEVRI